MPKFQISGVWYEAPNYAAARALHLAAQAPAHGPAPVAAAPAPVVFTSVVTPVDNFAGRSMTRFGVGEEVDLSFTTLPPRPAASFGGLQWAVKSGPGTLVAPVATNGTARLVMGNTAGTLVLELRTLPGPGVVATVKTARTVWVVEPSSAVMVREPGTGVYHRHNTASAGFYGLIEMRPTDVSFYRCQFREGSAPIRATGSLKVTVAAEGPSSDGKAQKVGVKQELANLAGSRHPVMGDWADIGRGNQLTGSVLAAHDDVTTATLDPPFAPGTFDWDIPWYFRVIASNTEKVFHTVNQSEVVTATGQMTSSKGGCTVTCQAADPDSDK